MRAEDTLREDLAAALAIGVPPGFERLGEALAAALERAAVGKGAERHGDGRPWHEQPIVAELAAMNSPAFALGQARKKLLESLRLDPEAAAKECSDAIVYAAAAWLHYRGRAGS